ncbi:hypothetical protein RBSH_02248 [Rhodopirellula baltica SH28]|uniref:Uncharacterized protein n=1 Tax=Rhodopirellula baltica SH28 TaxID=993517 RepID=K5DIE7_RHOBT|nr:hypothetical protein RBSH_02248 [Rhodopirellula baltica SH28]
MAERRGTSRVGPAYQSLLVRRSCEHRLYRPGECCGSVKLHREVKLCRLLENPSRMTSLQQRLNADCRLHLAPYE